MSRAFTTLEQERARLRAGAVESNYLERKRELFTRQVSELAERLLPDVELALKKEATSDIADEWLNDARDALRAAAPELPADIQCQPAFQAALTQIRAALSDSLYKDVVAPKPGEIQEHAHELAQLLLGKWFAILEDKQARDASEAIALSVNGLPSCVDQSELYEGAGSFAVPTDSLVVHTGDYLKALAQTEVARGEPYAAMVSSRKT